MAERIFWAVIGIVLLVPVWLFYLPEIPLAVSESNGLLWALLGPCMIVIAALVWSLPGLMFLSIAFENEKKPVRHVSGDSHYSVSSEGGAEKSLSIGSVSAKTPSMIDAEIGAGRIDQYREGFDAAAREGPGSQLAGSLLAPVMPPEFNQGFKDAVSGKDFNPDSKE